MKTAKVMTTTKAMMMTQVMMQMTTKEMVSPSAHGPYPQSRCAFLSSKGDPHTMATTPWVILTPWRRHHSTP
jgi:hypothetical protein